MKNIFKSLMLVAVAAMAFTSCNKENFNDNLVQDNSVTMTFVADAPESRTSVSVDGGTAKFSWSAGDKVGFYYVDVEGTGKKKQGSKEATISGSTATFSASFEQITGATAYNVGAFYPSDSWVNTSHADENPFNNVKVKIPSSQTLTEGTFDPEADLMMSKPFMGIALSSDNTKTLQFSRIAAIGKMNLKLDGMENGEVIESVKLGFAEGTHFNGPVSIDLENSSYTLGTSGTSNAVTLTGELVANEDRTAIFFTCFPGEYSGDYTIEVKTDKATYTKKATISNALVFTAGNVLNFNATVGNRKKEEVGAGQVVDELNRAFTEATTTSYIDWSGKTSNSTAVYAGNSAGGNESIQLRSSNNNSGIITTASAGKVRKIEVVWNKNTSTGRTLNIYGKNSAYAAATDLYTPSTQGTLLGSIKMGTSTVLEITGDYAFIGIRSSSSAMYISEIKITWEVSASGGEQPETPAEPVKLATPTNLQTPNITENSFTLTWSAVANASSYKVTCGSEEKDVTVTTAEFTGLTANTKYNVSVVAVGDGVNYTKSDAATTSVITLAEQTGGGDTKPVEATLSFANKAQRTQFSTSKQVWEQNGIKFTNDKGSSTSNIADYANPIRLYANSKVTVEAPGNITEIVFDCNSPSYANTMKSSIGTVSGATVKVSSDKVTVTFSTAVDSFTVAKLTAQVRLDAVTVTYK